MQALDHLLRASTLTIQWGIKRPPPFEHLIPSHKRVDSETWSIIPSTESASASMCRRLCRLAPAVLPIKSMVYGERCGSQPRRVSWHGGVESLRVAALAKELRTRDWGCAAFLFGEWGIEREADLFRSQMTDQRLKRLRCQVVLAVGFRDTKWKPPINPNRATLMGTPMEACVGLSRAMKPTLPSRRTTVARVFKET